MPSLAFASRSLTIPVPSSDLADLLSPTSSRTRISTQIQIAGGSFLDEKWVLSFSFLAAFCRLFLSPFLLR